MKLSLLLSTLLAGLFAAHAQATVLDFEGLTTSSAISLNAATSNYGGFTWANDFVLYNDGVYPTPAHSGQYGIVNNFGITPMSVSSATPFDFTGAWLNGWSFNSPSAITVLGYDAANNLVGSTGPVAITVGTEIYVSANFNQVSRLDFVGGQFYTIDDFTFNQNQGRVPEPESLLLVGAGVLALSARQLGRRK